VDSFGLHQKLAVHAQEVIGVATAAPLIKIARQLCKYIEGTNQKLLGRSELQLEQRLGRLQIRTTGLCCDGKETPRLCVRALFSINRIDQAIQSPMVILTR
jgi:hypothetical protein